MNYKGVATIFSFIFYIIIGLFVLGIVISSSVKTINKNEQNYKYEDMINNINKIYNAIIYVSNNKLNYSRIIINNPEVLEIDCENNKIVGNIKYDSKYRTDENTIINGIITYKKINNIYFIKQVNTNNFINLDCNNIYLNKGKNSITIEYSDYNTQTNKININIFRTEDINYENVYVH